MAFSTRTARAVLRDVRRAVGPDTEILLGDGFTPTGLLVREAGAAAEGVYLGVSGLINESFACAGPRVRRRVRSQPPRRGDRAERRLHRGGDRGAARRDRALGWGSRAGVRDALFRTDLQRGLTGRVRFDRRGDIVAPAVTILRISEARGGALPTFPGANLDRLVRTR